MKESKKTGNIIDYANIESKIKMDPIIPENDEDSAKLVVDFKEVLSFKLLQMMNNIENKLMNGRIKDKESEKIKIEYYKTYVSLVNSYTRLVSDRQSQKVEVDKMKELLNMVSIDDSEEDNV